MPMKNHDSENVEWEEVLVILLLIPVAAIYGIFVMLKGRKNEKNLH